MKVGFIYRWIGSLPIDGVEKWDNEIRKWVATTWTEVYQAYETLVVVANPRELKEWL